MKRSEFLATVFGAPVAAKAIDMTPRPDGKPPFLVFEVPTVMSLEAQRRCREEISPFAKEHGFKFAVLSGGMTVKRVL